MGDTNNLYHPSLVMPYMNWLSNIIKCMGLLCLLLLTSCGKDDRTELFELNHIVDFDIPPGLNTYDTHFFIISPLPSFYQDKLALQGLTTADIGAVEAKTAILTSTFGDINLEFIHRISVHIFDPFNPSNKIEFLYLDPTPFRNESAWRLFPGLADISEWVEKEHFGIEIRLEFREISHTFIPMRLHIDMRAFAK